MKYFGSLLIAFLFSCGEVSDCFVEYMNCKNGSDSEEVRAICSVGYEQCKDNEEKDND
tara:strand:- start:122 stop:295 length:174 start_codon:yes stop_codon:yes gene_type:complete